MSRKFATSGGDVVLVSTGGGKWEVHTVTGQKFLGTVEEEFNSYVTRSPSGGGGRVFDDMEDAAKHLGSA